VRENYIKTRMADVPQAYMKELPVTEDESQLRTAEFAIRAQYKKDLASPAPVAPPGQPVDTSNLSGIEALTLGLKEQAMGGAAPAPPSQPIDNGNLSVIDALTLGLKEQAASSAGGGLRGVSPR
jgi:hypothetical protein